MSDLHWSVWGFVQHAEGNPAEDFWSYGLERLGRSKARMGGADFGRHLGVVRAPAGRALRSASTRTGPEPRISARKVPGGG